MKRAANIFIPALVVLALVLATGIASYADPFDLDSAEEVKGLAGSISYSRTWGFTLNASSGERFRLLMHPMRFLDETKLQLGANDRVSVSGYKVDDDAILVTRISKGSTSYEIADPNDWPRGAFGPRAGNRPGPMRGPGRGFDGRGRGEGYGMHGDRDWDDGPRSRGGGWCW
jgi:hypothetical protein